MSELLQQNGASENEQSAMDCRHPASHPSFSEFSTPKQQSTIDNQKSTILNLSSISAGYRDRPVLHDIEFSVDRGERLALIGPNGCGKTTLLKVIAGALRATNGHIAFRNEDISSTPTHLRMRNGIGYLMQIKNMFPSLSVEENLHLSYWHGDGEFTSRLAWLLDIFPMLKDHLARRAGLLSGGERQALAIGMAIIRPVTLLLLDEPTAGLSPKAAEMILQALSRAQDEANFTSIMVEHNLRLIQPWVSRVLVMQQGNIVADRNDPSVLLEPEQLQRYYFA